MSTFIKIVDEIHKKIEKQRLSAVKKGKKEKIGRGREVTIVTGDIDEYFNQRRGLDFYFFLYLWYEGIISDENPLEEVDVTILLNMNISDTKKKGKLLEIWESINTKLHDTFPEWMQIIAHYNLHQYYSKENSKALVNWVIDKYLFNPSYEMVDFSTEALISIIEQSNKVLDIDEEKKAMLVLGDDEKVFKNIFTGKINYTTCTFCPEDDYYYNCLSLNSLLLEDDSIQVIRKDDSDEQPFPFEDAQFDSVYSFIRIKDNDERRTKFIDGLLKLLANNGLCYIFYQPVSIHIRKNIFRKYDYPLIAASESGMLYVCKNSNCQNKIRSLVMNYSHEGLFQGMDIIIEYFVNLIKEGAVADDYQELSKEDFLYAPVNNPLYTLFRVPDQMDFVYKPLSDIISYPEYNQDVPAKEIPNSQIVETKTFSDNPFNQTLSPAFYLDSDVVDETFSNIIKKEGFCIEENHYGRLIPHFYNDHYSSVADDLSILDKVGIVSPMDRNILECRIMKKPGILCNCEGNLSFLKVNASEETPVCYRRYGFGSDFDSFYCYHRIREILISPDYDEDFIIYQICNSKKFLYLDGSYILVAPTKEKQRAYFLKKREEYRLKNAELVNEIRNEERRKLSVDLHYLKHDASQYLSTISSVSSSFKDRLRQNGTLNLTDTFGRSGNTVRDYVDDLGKCATHVTKFLEQMTFLTDVLPQKPMDICQLLQNYVDSTLTTKNYKVELYFSNNVKGVRCLLDERLHKAFENILSNAERHAFINRKRKDYKVVINAEKDGDVVILTFSNNGTPPDSTLTEEGFFTRGLHVGPTGHSGFGGSIIRETVEAQNGIVHLHLNDNSEYPFQIVIKLPAYYD